MRVSAPNSDIPSLGIEIDLGVPLENQGVDWNAEAQTSLTSTPEAESFKSSDYVPGERSSRENRLGDDRGQAAFAVEKQGTGARVWQRALRRILQISLLIMLGIGGGWFALVYFFDADTAELWSYLESLSGEGDHQAFLRSAPAPASPQKKQLEKVQQDKSLGILTDVGAGQATNKVKKASTPAQAGLLHEGTSSKEFGLTSLPDPYEYLPNPMPPVAPLGRVWSAEEDETWRAGIAHRYSWQRYKTVKEVREARLLQSNTILWDALEDRNFWIRMTALFSLAEFGIPVSVANIAKALGETRASLQTNFFKRFYRSTPAERYVLRKALPLVNAQSRREILSALMKTDDHLNGLYLKAAKQDRDGKLRLWAEKMLGHFTPQQRQHWEKASCIECR